jgi:hypothetical protein
METKYIATTHISNNMGCGIKEIDYNEETVTVDLVYGDCSKEFTVKFYPNVDLNNLYLIYLKYNIINI